MINAKPKQNVLLEDMAVILSTMYAHGQTGKSVDFQVSARAALISISYIGAVLKIHDSIYPLVVK